MHRATPAALALTVASALTLTACGGSGGADVDADAEQTLTVWAMGTEGEKLAEVADVYEKSHPNITVKVTPVGWDVAHQKLVAAAAAGRLPDVMQMGGTYLGEFADMGVLEPVDTRTVKEDDFFPAAWQQASYDGETYGVPWYVDTRVLFYRTDLARKAGLTEPPATMDDLLKAAQAHQDKARTTWGLSVQPGGLDTVQSFYPFLYSAGGEIIDEDGKAAVNSPEAVKALETYGEFFAKGLSEKAVRPGYDVTKDFNTGDVPMFFGGPWIMSLLDENYPDIKGKWAVAPCPPTRSPCRWPAAPASPCPRTASTRPPPRSSSPSSPTRGPVRLVRAHPRPARQPAGLGDRRTRHRPQAEGLARADGDREDHAVPSPADRDHLEGGLRHRVGHPGQVRRQGRPGQGAGRDRRARGVTGMPLLTKAAADPAAPLTKTGPDGPPGEGRRPRRPLGRHNLYGWLFSTPFLVLFAVFMAFPIVATLLMSFTDFGARHVTRPLEAQFVGLENYTRLFEDDRFLKALFNTAYFVVVGVPLTILLGLLVAILLNNGIDRARTFFRVGFYAPVVTAIVAVAVVWRFVLDPSDGLIAGLAAELGLTAPDFLGSETWAMPSLIAMAVWRNLGTVMVLFIAGLQAIPADVREAARLDGAGAWQEMRRITVPLLRPTMLYATVITSIGYLNVFEEPFVMTQGGPSDATLTVSLDMYREGFNFFHMGYASAMAYVLFVVITGITVLQLRLLKDNTR